MEELVSKIDEEELINYPCIPIGAAAILFNWTPELFEIRFHEALHKKIRSVTIEDGQELMLLEDVLRAAFPDASDDIIYIMSLKCCRDFPGFCQHTGLPRLQA